jgi:hypothetical protein
VRYVLLLVVALVFLTGVVWWLLFLFNGARRLLRRH